jgi:hypothetical protein
MRIGGDRESECEKRCGNCIFYIEKYRECRRYPPVFTIEETSTNAGHLYWKSGFGFPEVSADDWCGEFKEK